MKAIILCGGMGTRLREHTETRPKPMVEIGGYPILWHIMKLYAHHGIKEFILCLGYKSHVIKEYFLNYEALSSDFTIELGKSHQIMYHRATQIEENWKVTLVETGESANTGARVKRASKYLDATDKDFAVTYGDGVSDVDLTKALAFHRSHDGLATLTGVRPPSRFGEIDVNGKTVVSFSEKPQVGQGLINGGFLFFKREFLSLLSDDPQCSLERGPMERCAEQRQLYLYEHSGYWQCMDTYRDWDSLERQWQSGTAPWKVWK